MTAVLRPGDVTSIGSLPHRSAEDAAAFIVRHHPELPAAPQLPRRSPAEGMIAQSARGLAGVTIDGNTLTVDVHALDASADVRTRFDGSSHAGLLAFLSLVAGRTDPVKLQLTGPITLGLALADAGAPAPLAYAVAASAVRAEARALVDLVRRRLPDAPLVIFFDEPGLTRVPDLGVDAESATDVLSSALAAIEEDAVTGVHCCGPTDWRVAADAGARVLSMPVDLLSVPASATALAGHLDGGRWIAWGVVPTHEPVGTDPDRLWRRLQAVWSELADAGCDPALLRRQAIVTPACGLAGHGVSQAGRALKLASSVAERVADEGGAARRSAGA